MASLLYLSEVYDDVLGDIDWDGNAFKMMLVTNTYSPNKTGHLTRSDVTNEVTGSNYTSGGVSVTPTVYKDVANNKVTITFASVRYSNLTVSNIWAGIIYKSTGTASTDRLVAYVDFGSGSSPSGQHFDVTFTSPITYQNA